MPSEKHKRGSKTGRDVVLDTCCVVNLAAIDGTLDCLASFKLTWYVPTAVQTEGVFIRTAADSREVHRIDLTASITKGTVQICSPADDAEYALYVELALNLGDGEAMALAIAKNRGWKVATDDRKARNKADGVGVSVVTTPELVQRWASETARSRAEVAMALRRIETLARFSPAENSPAAKWWRDLLDENLAG
jgi:predicted nucleic acid-binding protein